ncbi:class I SAM-dependent methyltransferase [Frankia sp. Cas3]|uniref:class I SAM-dependent methyltransferase n=1 Tax=Frankia sp. Cas3 TaxID=3073926 RepID=UPI002AD30C98|nr:class I SAM-dependent methyltransferase [Frankia sp. Cas3]
MSEHLDPVAVNTAVWEQHARARIVAGDLDRRPAVHQFRWTRTSIDDPGPELLGDVRGKHVVELGCGTGDNLAYLVDHRGALGVGIDPAPSQIRRARARWPSPVFHCTDAAPYLATCEPIDVCYSVDLFPVDSLPSRSDQVDWQRRASRRVDWIFLKACKVQSFVTIAVATSGQTYLIAWVSVSPLRSLSTKPAGRQR